MPIRTYSLTIPAKPFKSLPGVAGCVELFGNVRILTTAVSLEVAVEAARKRTQVLLYA